MRIRAWRRVYVTPCFGRGLAAPGYPPNVWWGRISCAVGLKSPVRTEYRDALDDLELVQVHVEFETCRDEVVDYALVPMVRVAGRFRTVRIYDGAHGRNEMHRYTTKLGKQPAEVFHRGTLGEGMRAALEQIKHGYEEMVSGWQRA